MKKYVSLILALAMIMSLVSLHAVAEDLPHLHVLGNTDVRQVSWAEMGMFKDAAAAAGVIIDWEEISTGWAEKKPIILASGDLPDIIIAYSLPDSDIITNIDSFQDMTDLIPQYAPNVQKMFDEVPDSLASGTFLGGIYSLPLVTAYRPTSYVTLNINKTWLDKLGMDIPTTLDEFEACLIAFRDNDVNGNGDPNDEIPLDFPVQGHAHDIYCLTGAFGTVDNQSTHMTVVEDGKIKFLYETEAFYKLTQYIHRWYKEGLITPEVYTNDYAASNVVRTTGDIATVGAATGYNAPSLFSKFSDQYVSIPPLASSEEVAIKWPFSTSGAAVNANKLVMSRTCQNKEAAMRFINELFSDDFGIQEYYGSFDTGAVTKYDDGTYSIQLVEGYGSIDEMKWYLSPVDNGPGYFSADLQSRTRAPAELTDRTEVEKLYTPYKNDDRSIWPVYARFDEEQTEELVYLQSDIENLVNQKMASWCVNGGIEDEWDAYLQSLQNMGLEDMRAIYQSVYDEFWAQQE